MTAKPIDGVPIEAVRVELERVLAGAIFSESPRLAAFLRYVVEARLNDQDDRIQEYGIGLEVFERGERFDPRIDSIVRVEARRLRDRLARHYETADEPSAVRIELPRRGYVPRFVFASEAAVPGKKTLPRDLSRPATFPWIVAAGSVVLALAAWVGRPPASNPPRTIAFPLVPPSGAAFIPAAFGGGAVVSPDGRRVVFAAGVPDGTRSLWVRELDQIDAKRVSGTEGAAWPFWSPDSRRIGFGGWIGLGDSNSRLSTVDLDSGSVQRLAPTPRYNGGAWSPRDGGVIVYCPELAGPLFKIPASGGDPVPLTELSGDDHGHRWPSFLPDGERFLFAAAPERSWDVDVRIGSLAGGEATTLLQAGSRALYVEQDGRGRLLFVRDETLLSQPFDSGSEKLSGAATPLLGEVERGNTFSWLFDFSASLTGVWTAHKKSGYVPRSELVWYDRAGRRLGTVGAPDHYFYISLSPDERLVAAVTGVPGSGNVDIWTIDAARGVAQRRTSYPGLDRTPIWSPDGGEILFNSAREGSRMYRTPREGGPLAELPAPGPDEAFGGWPTDWNAQVGRVVFMRKSKLYAVRPGGPTEPLIEAEYSTLNGKLSPDGRLLAYGSMESGEREIWLSHYPDVGVKTQVSSAGGNYPLWRGDGRELFYLAPDGVVMAVDVDPDANPPVSRPKRLFQARVPFTPAATVYRYAVTRDGQRFLCTNVLGGSAPMVVLGLESE